MKFNGFWNFDKNGLNANIYISIFPQNNPVYKHEKSTEYRHDVLLSMVAPHFVNPAIYGAVKEDKNGIMVTLGFSGMFETARYMYNGLPMLSARQCQEQCDTPSVF